MKTVLIVSVISLAIILITRTSFENGTESDARPNKDQCFLLFALLVSVLYLLK